MARSTIKVTVTGDATDAQRALRDTSEAAEDMGRRTSRVGDIVRGVLTAQAITSGARELGGFLRDSIQAAQEDEAAQRQLAQTLQNTTDATDDQVASVEEWIHNVQSGTGVLDDDLRPALGNLLRATHNTTDAQHLLSTSLDISAATGRDLEAVSLAVARAYQGNVSGLSRLGIAVKDAEGDTLSWTETQKQLNETFGGAADAAAESTAGRIAILKARFEDFKETVGGKVLPVIISLADIMEAKVIPAIQLGVEWVKDNIVPALQDFAKWVGDEVVPVIVLLASEIADDFQPKLEAIYNFIRANVIPILQQFAHWIGDEVTPRIVELSRFLNDHRDYVYAAAAGITLALVPALIAWATSAAAAAVATIAAAAPVIAITAALAALGVGIYAVYKHWDDLTAFLNAEVMPVLELLGRILADSLTGGLYELERRFGFAGEIAGWFKSVIDSVSEGISWLIHVIADLVDWIGRIHFPSPPSWITSPARAVGGFFGGIPGLASGGVVTGPTLAMIGEAGPEAVIPLDRLSGGGGGGVTVVVQAGLVATPAVIGQQIHQALVEHRRRVGSGLGLG